MRTTIDHDNEDDGGITVMMIMVMNCDDTYDMGKNGPACLVSYEEDITPRKTTTLLLYHHIRNCPVVMMEAMNDECQEAIIGAFTRMHPNEIYLTKEQASECILHAFMSGLVSHSTPYHPIQFHTIPYRGRMEDGVSNPAFYLGTFRVVVTGKPP